MTVAELIEKLKTMPQDMKVICDKAYEDGYYRVDIVDIVDMYLSKVVYIGTDPHNWEKEQFS